MQQERVTTNVKSSRAMPIQQARKLGETAEQSVRVKGVPLRLPGIERVA